MSIALRKTEFGASIIISSKKITEENNYLFCLSLPFVITTLSESVCQSTVSSTVAGLGKQERSWTQKARKTDIQADKQTDRQTDRQAGGQTGRPT